MKNKIGKFIVIRHHESEWNKQGLWTGLTDIGLTDYGFDMSFKMGELIKDVKIDRAYCSALKRSEETLVEILKALDLVGKIPVEKSSAINERDYGDYTGKNKWDMKELVGEEKFDQIRRAWDCSVPNGETLKMVYARALPYYLENILPNLKKGENVLMVAHGNSIRALMKYIEKIPEEQMEHVEMLFGGIVIYDVDENGYSIKKEVRQLPSKVNA